LGVRANRIIRMEDGRLLSDTRSPGRSAKEAGGDHGSDSDLGPSDLGLGLMRPPRPKSILPPFAVPDHG
jgi:hypothetical protein